MAPTNSTRERVRKTDEQLQVLRELYRSGMNYTRDAPRIAEAVQRTNLSSQVIKQWINNQRKPNRGKQKKKAACRKYNIYTAFISLPYENFNGNPQDMCDMVRERGQKYQELKSTEAGLKLLHENMERMNLCYPAVNLSETEKHNRALGIYQRIQQDTELLNKLGYKSVAMVAQPERPPTFLGPAASVMYLRNNVHIADDFVDSMGQKKASPDQKTVLRQKVQMLFNRLYADATGHPGAKMPYQHIGDGTIKVAIAGLPEGIAFKKPHSYGPADMLKILESTLTLTIESAESSNSVTTHSPPSNGDSPANAVQQQEVESQEHIAILQFQDDAEDDFVLQLENIAELEVEAIDDVHSIEISSQETIPTHLADVITLDHPSLAESLQHAKDLAKKAEKRMAKPQRRGLQKSNTKPNKSSNRSKKNDIVGQRIQQVFITSAPGKKEKRKTYTGTVINKYTNKVTVEYDDPEEDNCTFSTKQFELFKKSKTLVFID